MPLQWDGQRIYIDVDGRRYYGPQAIEAAGFGIKSDGVGGWYYDEGSRRLTGPAALAAAIDGVKDAGAGSFYADVDGVRRFGFDAIAGEGGSLPRIEQILEDEDAGFAVVFSQDTPELYIKDPTTPANNYKGDPGVKLTTVRATLAWYFNSAGLLVSAANNVPRYTYDPVTLEPQGLLIEGGRVNVALWNRDLTNAAWTKSNVTAAKDQIGMDGVAASASKITATANAGTVLQAITLASSARFQSAYVKRLVGTGTLEMTMDGGTTWAVVTPAGAGWERVSIPTQTIANPNVGFRIGTSGDSFAVDLVQNENGAHASSPMVTTTAAFSRAVDIVTVPLSALPFDATRGTLYAKGNTGAINTLSRTLVSLDDGGSNTNAVIMPFSSLGGGQMAIYSGSANVANPLPGVVTVGLSSRISGTWALNDARAALDGVPGTPDTSMALPIGMTMMRIGSTLSGGNPFYGTISELAYLPRVATNDELVESSISGWPGAPIEINIAPNDASIEDSDYAATLTKSAVSVSGRRPIDSGDYDEANPGWRRTFKTSAPTVIVHLEVIHDMAASHNGKGQILVDGLHKQYFTAADALGTMQVLVNFNTVEEREIAIVMPYSAGIAHKGLSTFGYSISSPDSRAALPRAVYAGDSRAQGFSATSIDKWGFELLCRAKGWQNIAMGNGSSTTIAANGTIVGNADPDIVLITNDYNNKSAQTALATFKSTLISWIGNVRAVKPDVPIYVVSSNWISAANDALTLKMADYRQQQLDAVNELTAAGDDHLFYIDGLTLTTNSTASQPDGIHPNDAGFAEWATNISPLLSLGETANPNAQWPIWVDADIDTVGERDDISAMSLIVADQDSFLIAGCTSGPPDSNSAEYNNVFEAYRIDRATVVRKATYPERYQTADQLIAKIVAGPTTDAPAVGYRVSGDAGYAAAHAAAQAIIAGALAHGDPNSNLPENKLWILVQGGFVNIAQAAYEAVQLGELPDFFDRVRLVGQPNYNSWWAPNAWNYLWNNANGVTSSMFGNPVMINAYYLAHALNRNNGTTDLTFWNTVTAGSEMGSHLLSTLTRPGGAFPDPYFRAGDAWLWWWLHEARRIQSVDPTNAANPAGVLQTYVGVDPWPSQTVGYGNAAGTEDTPNPETLTNNPNAYAPPLTVNSPTAAQSAVALGALNDGLNTWYGLAGRLMERYQSGYTIVAVDDTVDEGATVTFNITGEFGAETINVDLTGIAAADLVENTLSFAVNLNGSGIGSFQVTLVNDLTTEGAELITATIRGTPITEVVTVADTSQATGVPDPIFQYRMDTGSGEVLEDSGPNNLDGFLGEALVGTTRNPDWVATGLDFITTDICMVPHSDLFNEENLVVAAVAKTDILTGTHQLIAYWDSTDATPVFAFRIVATELQFLGRGASPVTVASVGAGIDTSAPHLYVATVSGTAVTLRMDGVQIATGTLNNVLPSSPAARMCIGARWNTTPTENWDGIMSHAAMYPSVPAGELATLEADIAAMVLADHGISIALPPRVEYTASEEIANTAAPTFVAKAFGDPATDRVMLAFEVYKDGAGGSDFTGTTIGGVAATEIATAAASGALNMALHAAAVPSGATGDVDVDVSSATGTLDTVMSLLRLTGCSITPHDTAQGLVGDTSISLSIDCPAGGVIVAGCYRDGGAPVGGIVWTNVDELDEFPFDSDQRNLSVAAKVYSTVQTGLSITAAKAEGGANVSLYMVVASFPALP